MNERPKHLVFAEFEKLMVVMVAADRKKFNEQTKEIRQLKSELNRREKALAEAAPLLILKKKVQQIWGEKEDD